MTKTERRRTTHFIDGIRATRTQAFIDAYAGVKWDAEYIAATGALVAEADALMRVVKEAPAKVARAAFAAYKAT
jgi:Mn-containing catalase